jgi:hypothetical protein
MKKAKSTWVGPEGKVIPSLSQAHKHAD